MNLLAVFAASALVAVSLAADTCNVESGRLLRPYRRGGPDKAAKLDIPCKYIAINQTCGSHFIKLVPGNIYVAPNFFIDTMWMMMYDVDSPSYRLEGRMSSKTASKYILDMKDSPFNKKDGTVNAEYFMTFNRTATQVVVRAVTGDWELIFAPYDPTGEKRRNVEFSFTCFRDDTPPDFPMTMCGGQPKLEDVQTKAQQIGLMRTESWARLFTRPRDKTYYWAILENMAVDQTPNPSCYLAMNAFAACPAEKKADAMESCYRLLYSKMHRRCASLFTCDIMETFANCIATVCSDFDEDLPALLVVGENPENITACQRIGEAIDFCREFPMLSQNVSSSCYPGMFIGLEVDEPEDEEA